MSAAEPEIMPNETSLEKSTPNGLAEREPNINDWVSQAIATGDMNTIERVLAMRKELKEEAAKEEFFRALAKFQALVPAIPKRKKGFGYLYAPLGDIDRGIKTAMEEAGLSKRWEQVETGDQVTVSCVITHIGGHSESATIGPVSWDLLEKTERMNGLQHRAAVIAYLQRYTLLAAGGIATADDIDAAGITPNEARPKVNDDQLATLEALAEEVGANVPKFCEYLKVKKLADIPANRYNDAVKALNAKRK